MRRIPQSGVLIVLLSLMVILFFLLGIYLVPFHPDESSMLYQSRDLESLFSNPASLVWVPERGGELDQKYRLLNPPIPKYIIGLGRISAGYGTESVAVDWDWSAPWEQNVASTALPSLDLLLASRIAITLTLLCSLFPIILIARRLSGNGLAIIVIVLFGLNSLILLHGRRAMSEGALIFGISLAILGILEADKRPWLAGLGTAIAVSSKLSAGALLPVGLLAIIWRQRGKGTDLKARMREIAIFAAVLIVVTLMLNPILWSNPIASARGIWDSRVDFSIRQLETIKAVSPDQVLETPIERIRGMLVMMFIREPQTSEVANYIEITGSDEVAYLSNPINSISSGLTSGGIVFLITVLGVVTSLVQYKNVEWKRQREIVLLLLGTTVQAVAILIANSIPFQRYYIPLVPFTIIWMGLGVYNFPGVIKKAARSLGGLIYKSPSPYSRK